MKKRVKVSEAPVGEDALKKKRQINLDLPFKHASGMTARAFALCRKGILISDLVSWVKAQGGEPRRILREMRTGNRYGKTWEVHEDNGYLRIVYKG